MTIVVPTFPFTAEEVEVAREFRETLAELCDSQGPEVSEWDGIVDDPDFCAAVGYHWALLSGRAPSGVSLSDMVKNLSSVSGADFERRLATGTSTF
jgi:hypothetical protein